MSASLAVQLCRIVAPERLSDRFLSSGVLTASNSRQLGNDIVLAYLFEVMQPWLPSAKLLPALNATLEAEFPKLIDPKAEGNIDDKFELLLRAVNQTLNNVSEEGETDWIGNLNGILMVFSGEELHFSQTGRCPAYLLQNNRIRQVTDDPNATPQDPHPLKTFSNLATGQLKDGDQILVANHELYREISLDALRRILNTATPYQSAQSIAKELKREKNPAVATLIFKFATSLPNEPEPETVVMEEEMQSGLKKFGKRMLPFLERAKKVGAKAGSAAGAATKQAQTVIAEKVAPKVGELVQRGKEALTKEDEPKQVEQEKIKLPPVEGEEPEKPVVEVIASKKHREKLHLQAIADAATARIEDEEIFTSVIPDDERSLEHKAPIADEQGLLGVAKTHSKNLLGTIVAFLKNFTHNTVIWLRVPMHRKIAALGGGILILLLMIFIGVRASHRTAAPAGAASNETIITDVKALETKITTAIGLSQDIEASKDIQTSISKLNTLNNPSSSERSAADTLLTAIQSQSDTLGKTTRFAAATAQYAFTATARGLFSALPYFYGWDPTSTNLLRTGIGDVKQTQGTIPISDPNDTIVSAAKSNETDTAGYALTKGNKVFRVVQNGTQTLLRPIAPAAGDFAVGDSIGTYNGNVYVLDSKAGLLWKYANSGTTYSKGVSIIDINKYDIKKATSFAIDGSIYVLKSDGSLLKFVSGKQDTAFTLNNVPYLAQKLVQPIGIIADEAYSSIYVLDAGATSSTWSTARVLEFSKNGDFVRQYAFPKDLTQVHGFDIDPKGKKLWVLNDKTVNEFDLP